jgi:hypothetical protein
VGAARVGNYSHCSFRAEGTGTFFAGEGASPSAGKPGELSHEPEIRLEFLVPPAREDEVVRALLRAHPYEEPTFDLFERRGELRSAGRIGSTEPVTLGELAERTAESLHGSAPRIAGDREREVSRVAVVPGSGEDFAEAARRAGARRALDSGLALIDAGHAATERPGLERLLALLAARGIETVSLLELDSDPWSGAL